MAAQRILIVEDNEKNTKLFRDVLQLNGYETLDASTGEQAIELAIQHTPDLVLMDIRLPGTDGLEALRWLREDERTAHIPVLALTAQAMAGDRERFLAAGFNDYVAKPVNIVDFIRTVSHYCEGSGAPPATRYERFLSTVVFTDIVDSTATATQLGDSQWRATLGAHDQIIREQFKEHGGAEVKHTGDGFLASFDGPARAVQCALAIAREVSSLGISIRAGIHTGEVERRGQDLAGIAVHIGARVAALAGENEVLVTRTVKELVAGSGLSFSDRGEHTLKGVPEAWRLFRAWM
jgi:CheY-like chemotaxis protein